MKFAVALCALVACAAAIPQERNIIIDKVRSIVYGAISNAQSDVEGLKDDVKAFTSKVEGKMSNIVSSAKNEVASLAAKAETTIAGVVVKGTSAAICAQSAMTEMSSFQFSRSVDSCVVDTTRFEAQVLRDIVELANAIGELSEIVEECTSNILEAVVCAVTKVGTVETLMIEIVSSVKAALLVAEGKSAFTLSDVESCGKRVISEATAEYNKIINTVKTCA